MAEHCILGYFHCRCQDAEGSNDLVVACEDLDDFGLDEDELALGGITF